MSPGMEGQDAERLYEVDSDVPNLEGAVLLHYLDGFLDAGSAGQVFTDHLKEIFDHRIIARFDVDRLIDYRARRPAMTYRTDHWEGYQTPELVVHLMHDEAGTPFLLLNGPEPDREWERFAAAVRELVERWGVRLTLGVQGMPMDTPHTRPLGVTAHGTRTELVRDYPSFLNQIQVPGSAGALLEFRLGQAGHDALGFAVHVPHYLAQSVYPNAALALVRYVTKATDLDITDKALREATREADVEIANQVSQSAEIDEMVRGLEQRYDTFLNASARSGLLAESVEELPSADELASEFERYLADLGRDKE